MSISSQSNSKFWLSVFALLALSLMVSRLQAQQRLNQPTGLQFANDILSWNAVENAGGYQLRWWATSSNVQTADLPS